MWTPYNRGILIINTPELRSTINSPTDDIYDHAYLIPQDHADLYHRSLLFPL